MRPTTRAIAESDSWILQWTLAGVLLVAAGVREGVSAQEARRPNVLLIFADDLGSVDLHAYGSADLHTPHIDALAARGVRFTQFYSAAPVCSPSRAALLTGRYPQRAGVPGNVGSQPGSDGMPGEQVTIAEMMKSAGYVTGHVGKWHLGYTPACMPNAQGFDESFGHMGGCIDNFSHFFYWSGPNRHDLWRNGEEVWEDGAFFGDLMVRECRRFIHENRERAFFLYWAINMPHYPLQASEKWRKHYEDLPEPRKMYAAFVSTMDELIGEVVGTLEELELRDDTLIVFMSDNGHSTETRSFGGGGSAGPYRGAKFSLFEGGVRLPAIVSFPGRIPEGATRDQVGIAMDWLPTIAALAGVDLPASRIDGRSLVDVIRSPSAPSPHAALYWESGRGKWGPQWSVREGRWKLISSPNDTSQRHPLTDADALFLVDLAGDVGESRNVAAEHPETVERLKALHEEWKRSVR